MKREAPRGARCTNEAPAKKRWRVVDPPRPDVLFRPGAGRALSTVAAPMPQMTATKETNPRRLAQRQKQIDFGKNTIGYDRYVAAVPKAGRERMSDRHPVTPNKERVYSKRQWDGIVRQWRRRLHTWDADEGGAAPALFAPRGAAASGARGGAAGAVPPLLSPPPAPGAAPASAAPSADAVAPGGAGRASSPAPAPAAAPKQALATEGAAAAAEELFGFDELL
jgi:hypothetical protein